MNAYEIVHSIKTMDDLVTALHVLSNDVIEAYSLFDWGCYNCEYDMYSGMSLYNSSMGLYESIIENPAYKCWLDSLKDNKDYLEIESYRKFRGTFL